MTQGWEHPLLLQRTWVPTPTTGGLQKSGITVLGERMYSVGLHEHQASTGCTRMQAHRHIK